MLDFKQKTDIEAASQASAQPPLACLGLAQGLSASIQVLYQHGNPNLVTDTAIAALLLENTIRSSELNVLINLRSIKDDAFKQAARQIIQDAKSVLPDLEAIANNIVEQIS